MPGNYLNIDAEAPTFTGQETEREMIQELAGYLTQLTERLRYTLMNLDKSNFNRKGLQDIQAGATEDVEEQIQILTGLVNQTDSRVAALSVRVSAAESAIRGITGLPTVTVDDDGMILRVVNGAWAKDSLTPAAGESF